MRRNFGEYQLSGKVRRPFVWNKIVMPAARENQLGKVEKAQFFEERV